MKKTVWGKMASLLIFSLLLAGVFWVFSGAAASNTAKFQLADSPKLVDLTKEGTTDWIHWGYAPTSNGMHTTVERKNIKKSILPTYKMIAGLPSRFYDGKVAYKWSDGKPPYTKSDGIVPKGKQLDKVVCPTSGVCFYSVVGAGCEMIIPAYKTEKTLKLYFGAWRGTGKLEVFWVGSSKPVYTTTLKETKGQAINKVLTINYKGKTEKEKLKIKYVLTEQNGVGADQKWWSNITIQAMTLK